MTGLDTNILARYLAQDDPNQSARATHLIERELSVRSPGLISLVVLIELLWVLESAYEVSDAARISIVERLLVAKELRLEAPPLVRKALSIKSGASAGLTDILIGLIYQTQGALETATFDKRASKLPGWRLLK